jgi:hypothetical protein
MSDDENIYDVIEIEDLDFDKRNQTLFARTLVYILII